MRTFKDNEGREWLVSVNVEAVRRVKASPAAVDLMTILDGSLIARVTSDPLLLVDILFALCALQRPAVDLANFGNAIAGDVLDAAANALLEELIDFFPKARREVLRAGLDKSKAIESGMLARALAEVNAIDPAQPPSGASATSSPESPGSTLAVSVSAS